ncbi:hypothetical protein ACOMHN_001103 [Nucella lapillus]
MWCPSSDTDDACSWLDSSSYSEVVITSTYSSEESDAVRYGNEDDDSNSYDDDPPAYSRHPVSPPPYSLYDHGPFSGCDNDLPAYSTLDQCPPPYSLRDPGSYRRYSISDGQESENLVLDDEPDLVPAPLEETAEDELAFIYDIISIIEHQNSNTQGIENNAPLPPPSNEMLGNILSQVIGLVYGEEADSGGSEEDALPPLPPLPPPPPPPPPPPATVTEDDVVDQSYFPPPPSEEELANMLSGIGISDGNVCPSDSE